MSPKLNLRRHAPGTPLHHAGVALLGLAILIGLAMVAAAQRPARAADSEAATVVADQIRRQGGACEEPVKAERDTKRSAPNSAVWTLKCKNASYRVQLVPHSAAKVEALKN